MWKNSVALLFTGLAFGWLMGLSVTPMVRDVLTAVLATTTLFVGALSGLKKLPKRSDKDEEGDEGKERTISAVPLACFVVGMALGAPGGIVARTSYWFGPEPNADEPSKSKPVVDPVGHVKTPLPDPPKSNQGVGVPGLNNANSDTCRSIESLSGDALAYELRERTASEIRDVARHCDTAKCYEDLRRMLCVE